MGLETLRKGKLGKSEPDIWDSIYARILANARRNNWEIDEWSRNVIALIGRRINIALQCLSRMGPRINMQNFRLRL